MKTTLVLGASTDPHRYSNIAILKLRKYDYPVLAFGLDKGFIGDVEIIHTWNPNWEVDTVNLYLNPKNQKPFYDQIIALKPKRVFFNPGAENQEFKILLRENGIGYIEACTLVLLSLDDY